MKCSAIDASRRTSVRSGPKKRVLAIFLLIASSPILSVDCSSPQFLTFSRWRFSLVWLVYDLQLSIVPGNKVPLDEAHKIYARLANTEVLAKLAIKMDCDKLAIKIDIQGIYAGALFAIFYLLPHVAAVFASCWCIRAVFH